MFQTEIIDSKIVEADSDIKKYIKIEIEKYADEIKNCGIDHVISFDKDILRDLIINDNVYTTIYYLNRSVMGQQIADLVKVIGQDELIRRTGGSKKTIEFGLQKDMVKKSVK